MTKNKLFQEVDLSLEAIILLLAAVAMLILGFLLFPVYAGRLSYNENGLFGLLLVVFSLQIISMGRTPFGEVRRSPISVSFGVIIAAIGIVTCVIPDYFGQIPRALLILFFGAGGLFLLSRMFLTRDRYRLWKTSGGIFHHLIVGCGAVYLLQILIAVLICKPGLVTGPQMASVALLYGLSLIYLSWVLENVKRRYPPAPEAVPSDGGLSINHAALLLMGVFMVLLGLLLIPVSLGLLPFSASGQLGLLMFLLAIQMLTVGSTPIGPFPRGWLMIFSGLGFGALGVVSCIIPGILVVPLTLLVGLLNIAGGSIGMGTTIVSFRKRGKMAEPAPVILLKINTAVLVMNILSVIFGTTMLISGLVPGYIIGIVLAATGCVLFYLLRQLISLEKAR